MNKHIFKLFIFILSIFILNSKVNAECSYKERKELLNAANNIKVSMNSAVKDKEIVGISPETGEEVKTIKKENYFMLSLSNIPDNIFINVSSIEENTEFTVNKDNSDNGLYVYNINDLDEIYTYNLSFYSLNQNCYAEKITTKKIKKPKLNPIYYYSICKNSFVENNKYCKQFIGSEFALSEEKIIESLRSIVEEKTDNTNNESLNFIELIKKYWYIPTTMIIFIIFIISFVIIRKKRGKLR